MYYQEIIEFIKNNENLKSTLNKYLEQIEPIKNDIYDQLWYSEYVSRFPIPDFVLLSRPKDKFNRKLLTQLLAASCLYRFFIQESTGQLFVFPQHDDTPYTEEISNCSYNDIQTLFAFCVEEQMAWQLRILNKPEDRERNLKLRDATLNRWLQNVEIEDIFHTTRNDLLNQLG